MEEVETKIEMRKAFSIIKIVIAMIAIFLVVAGVYNNSLNINILFLLAFFTFFLTLIETYFFKRERWKFHCRYDACNWIFISIFPILTLEEVLSR
ncbi:hypothetical protein [Halalkalibacter okhensis]|uniref:Uncharacterized protein n=1 Tax=Halalkalibacter okhensis TaxID=333138 RepID=A0A0B0II36_9BACI|nr:hypothetical protein [Halalkalibacter okhensis]KHF39311.1 hypothetical protein LQ50_15570 [Halalkalibacter okhensis]